MDFLVSTKIEFMKYRHVCMAISGIAIILALISLSVFGLNFGIDFAGGTEVQINFRERPPIDEIRDKLKKVGLAESSIQQFGDDEHNEVLIRVPELEEEGGIDDVSKLIVSVLRDQDSTMMLEKGMVDLNIISGTDLVQLLNRKTADVSSGVNVDGAVKKLVDYRKSHGGLIADFPELQAEASMTDDEIEAFKAVGFFGDFSIRQIERVGPKVGQKLKSQSFMAVSFSVVFILLYIWFRFQFQYGIGAIAALIHDVIITLGILSLFEVKFTLTIIAAMLTLVGYSLNDTIIVFDRIRENLKIYRGKSIMSVIDRSMNETLSRTLMTSFSTLIVVICLYFLGGEVINGFAFTLLVGIIIGTYSSIAIASPVLHYWKKFMDAKKE